ALEDHGELACGQQGYSPDVRAGQLHGKAATRPSPLLRASITIRKAGDEVADEPGFFGCDTVAHCGPTLKGEFARTVNFTDVLTGWVFTRSIRNNAHVHIRQVIISRSREARLNAYYPY